MKSTVVAVFALLFGLLCLQTAAADERLLEHLEKEAREFSAEHAGSSRSPAKPKQAAVLLQAAEIMISEKDCFAALNLCGRAERMLSGKPDAQRWVIFSRAFACTNRWPEASWSGWLAYLGAGENAELRKTALALTGEALEKRISHSENWTPAAVAVHELLVQLGDGSHAEKLAQLRQKMAEDKSLRIEEMATEANSSQPKLCLRFNDDLLGPDAVHYGDYVQTEPSLASDFSVEENRLCIGGAAYGTEYGVTVRSGLKGKTKTLLEAVARRITTEHRKPALWFNQSDYVLASRSSRAVGLQTVNLDKVRLELFRIHERNILGDFVRDRFRSRLNRNSIGTVRDSVGEQIWKGSAEVSSVQDKTMTNAIVLPPEAIAAPGLYVLIAEGPKQNNDDESAWEEQASQWLVVTDIGLSTYQGSDGLTVVARSLETALPLAGARIGLYARNNAPLAVLETDASGQARFALGLLKGKGGQAAVHLMSSDDQHGFTFLQLDQAPFDLSDRGVGGRAAPGPLDAFVYTERGIYRPGEAVNIVALVRDQVGGAADAPPLTLRILGPDGKVVRERLLQPDPSGAYAEAFNLSSSARSGNWTASLHADVEAKPIGQASFQVKSFKPPRLEVRLEPQGMLSAQDKAAVAVQADYLYGAPGADLEVRARMSLQHDPHPFAEFPGFFFGRAGERPEIADIELAESATDAKGRGTLLAALDGQEAKTQQPLKAVVSVEVLDIDGRAASATTILPVRHLSEHLGVLPRFSDQQVPADSSAAFEVVALDGKGQPQDKGQIGYRLVREEIDYQWFQKDGDWSYEQIVRDQEEQRGQLAWEKPGPVALALPAGQGSYRLELLDKEGAVLRTSFRFTAGAQLVGKSDTPDSVKVTLDRQLYRAGETAKLTLVSPYPGQASLVLANSTVNGIRNFAIAGTEHSLDIPVEAGWGAGVYALVTVHRPGKDAQKGADRAVGLVWLPVDPAGQRLEVAVGGPEQTRPRRTVQIPVSVKGVDAGDDVRLTLAAVDEGVLQLTDFASPDPLAWFFGKQQLGLEIRDLYGQLIVPPADRPLVLRSGAGDDALRGAPKSNVRVVSLFSGLVKAGEDGTVQVPLEIPDFNGRLRLMAVAWTKSKAGSVSRSLQVNDPVVVSPSLPRYLAVGDRSTVQLLAENIDGPAGDYRIEWTAQGAVAMDSKDGVSATASLQPGKRQSLSFPVAATSMGSGSLRLRVTGPEGYLHEGEFALNVRGKHLPVLSRVYAKLEPGATVVLDKAVIANLFPESAKVDVSISSAPNLDVAGLLAELDRYPHGCLEQLTSRALPLLRANELAAKFGVAEDKALAGRTQNAVDLILQKQRGEGSFGLWSDSDEEEPWLSAYAMDFLGRAKEKGLLVPEYFYDRGLQWLSDQAKGSGDAEKERLPALAYAHWVLARAGQGRHEDARYLFDAAFDKLASPLAQAQLAGALGLMGDQDRLAKGLKAALRTADTDAAAWSTYGSRLRDLAGIVAVVAEAGAKMDPAPAWQELTSLLSRRKHLSTQEQAALIMAALTLEAGQPLDLEIMEGGEQNKQEPAAGSFFALSRSGGSLLDRSVTLRNKGKAAAWMTTVVQGTPASEPAPEENGFAVRRRWHTAAGEPLSLESLPQGQLAVAELQGETLAGMDVQAMLIDLLPAGFEIERSITGTSEADSAFGWLSDLTPLLYSDARDDRFVAAFDTAQLSAVEGNDKLKQFRAAYLVRAVVPGIYALPPSEVEAMYRPEFRARSSSGMVTIKGRE